MNRVEPCYEESEWSLEIRIPCMKFKNRERLCQDEEDTRSRESICSNYEGMFRVCSLLRSATHVL